MRYSTTMNPTSTGLANESPGAQLDESAFLKLLKAGDDRAFEQFVRANTPRMLATARRLLGNEEESHDAVQEAFLSAFKGLPAFSGSSRLSTWLHRITVNAALMRLRRRKARPSVNLTDLLPTFLTDGHRENVVPAWNISPEAGPITDETRELVRRKINELPDDYRTVIILRDIEELDTDATAEVLGTTPGAVKTRLHRARQALRTLLEKELVP